jgi:hypothetical protein
MKTLNDYQPFIQAHTQETECQNWINQLETEVHNIKLDETYTAEAGHQTTAEALANPTILSRGEKITVLERKLSALRRLLPSLSLKTNRTRREFAEALSLERQSEFTAIEDKAILAYLSLQHCLLEMERVVVEIEAVTQGEDARLKRRLPALDEIKPDRYSGYFSDIYANLANAGIKIPPAIRQAMTH